MSGAAEENYVLVLEDAQYKACWERITESGEQLVKDKAGKTHRFIRQGDRMFSQREDGLTQRVIQKSDEEAFRASRRPVREVMLDRLRADFPDSTEEELNAHADVLKEANDTIMRLVKAGMTPDKAKELVIRIMESETPPTSAEDIAEFFQSGVMPSDEGLKPSDVKQTDENDGASCGSA